MPPPGTPFRDVYTPPPAEFGNVRMAQGSAGRKARPDGLGGSRRGDMDPTFYDELEDDTPKMVSMRGEGGVSLVGDMEDDDDWYNRSR